MEKKMKMKSYVILLLIVLVSANIFAQFLNSEGKSPFVDIIRDARESVVNIQVEGTRRVTQGNRTPFDDEIFKFFFGPREIERPFSAMGSGFIFGRDGETVYILTNNHVAEGGRDGEITVTLADKEKLTAEIVGLDPDTDLAIIKITVSPSINVVVAELGDSDQIEIGEWAIAIGNPFGQLGLQRTVTVGVISAVGRSGFDFGSSSPMLQDYIQTDAAINPGNSGGPLLDINGKVIGVNAAITTTSGGSVGIGFAIPINMAKKVADDFLTRGHISRAYLGINPQEITPELSSTLGLNEISGALVSRVEKDSPADKGGLLAGDVILEVNDHRIEDVAKFRIVIADSPIGQRIPLTIFRNGNIRTIYVTLTAREDPRTADPIEEKTPTLDLGMRLDTLNSEAASRLNIRAETGLAIVQVIPNSPAAKVGIRSGDVLIALDRTDLKTIQDYEKVIEKAEKESLTTLLAYIVSRDGIYRFIPINVEK